MKHPCPRDGVAALARKVGRGLSRGRPGKDVQDEAEMLAETGAATDLVAGFVAEAARERPDLSLVNGYLFLLASTLELLRLDAEIGDRRARRSLDEATGAIEAAVARGGVPPEALMLVARMLAKAGVAPGPALQAAMLGAVDDATAAGGAPIDAAAIAGQLAEVATALDNDPFAIHAEVAGMCVAFPAEHRAAIAGAFAASGSAPIRMAALGFVLDRDAAAAEAVLAALTAEAAAPVPSAMVERLARMRPWLAAGRQKTIDAALRTLRRRAGPPEGAARVEILSMRASPCDGTGAQSLFAVIRRGRHHALASVLIKTGAGVKDAWVQDGLTLAEAEAAEGEVSEDADAVPSSVGFFERRVCAALVTNLEGDAPPPFGLVRVVESLALGALPPMQVAAGALAEELLAGLPAEQTDAAAAREAQLAYDGWGGSMGSWIEMGDTVEALLRPIRSRAKRIEAVLTRLLPARRGFWAEQCAWTAAALKVAAATEEEVEEDALIAPALVARDLAGDAPVADMPFAATVAAATVEAFALRPAR